MRGFHNQLSRFALHWIGQRGRLKVVPTTRAQDWRETLALYHAERVATDRVRYAEQQVFSRNVLTRPRAHPILWLSLMVNQTNNTTTPFGPSMSDNHLGRRVVVLWSGWVSAAGITLQQVGQLPG